MLLSNNGYLLQRVFEDAYSSLLQHPAVTKTNTKQLLIHSLQHIHNELMILVRPSALNDGEISLEKSPDVILQQEETRLQ